MRPSTVPFVYSKRTAVTRSLVSRLDGRSNVLSPFQAAHYYGSRGTTQTRGSGRKVGIHYPHAIEFSHIKGAFKLQLGRTNFNAAVYTV